jgi:hypothetical protein
MSDLVGILFLFHGLIAAPLPGNLLVFTSAETPSAWLGAWFFGRG